VNVSVERIKITHKRKRYVVVRDARGVLRVAYINAVMGRANLYRDGRVWKELAAAYPAAFKEKAE
jgi:hypothetical protein